jgi:voltage-gated potassium channel
MKQDGKDQVPSLMKTKVYEVIFESDTPSGKWYDIALLVLILISIVVVMLESIESVRSNYLALFQTIEWVITVLFLIDYILRIYCVTKPVKYITSFYGIIDLLSILPSFLAFFIAGGQSLMVIRGLRLLRVFRIFKLGTFLIHGNIIMDSMRQSRGKIAVFMYFIMIMLVIIGAVMYLIEGNHNEGFSNIPASIYWAVVTLTTVGYGDVTPLTNIGKLLSAFVMILGYAVIAVPTGIVSASMINPSRKVNGQACPHCSKEGHDNDAGFCKFCGGAL